MNPVFSLSATCNVVYLLLGSEPLRFRQLEFGPILLQGKVHRRQRIKERNSISRVAPLERLRRERRPVLGDVLIFVVFACMQECTPVGWIPHVFGAASLGSGLCAVGQGELFFPKRCVVLDPNLVRCR